MRADCLLRNLAGHLVSINRITDARANALYWRGPLNPKEKGPSPHADLVSGLIAPMQKALAEQEGTQGRSVEATKIRLETATSMERNLRERRLKVGLVVYRKTHAVKAA